MVAERNKKQKLDPFGEKVWSDINGWVDKVKDATPPEVSREILRNF